MINPHDGRVAKTKQILEESQVFLEESSSMNHCVRLTVSNYFENSINIFLIQGNISCNDTILLSQSVVHILCKFQVANIHKLKSFFFVSGYLYFYSIFK